MENDPTLLSHCSDREREMSDTVTIIRLYGDEADHIPFINQISLESLNQFQFAPYLKAKGIDPTLTPLAYIQQQSSIPRSKRDPDTEFGCVDVFDLLSRTTNDIWFFNLNSEKGTTTYNSCYNGIVIIAYCGKE